MTMESAAEKSHPMYVFIRLSPVFTATLQKKSSERVEWARGDAPASLPCPASLDVTFSQVLGFLSPHVICISRRRRRV